MTTLRTILSLVTIEDMEHVQMDVKAAFLHGDVDEDVYMQQPKGFIQEDARCQELVWYKRSKEDHCLYTRKLDDGLIIILVLYIDDMLIARKSDEEIANLKKTLSNNFAMKDLRDAKHFLGMQIKRDCKRCILAIFLGDSLVSCMLW
ncbi:hypothetical protein L7F22_064402 [Adiantum nelumboides]|nr:hypothetical protein [Adiantum nelumboides]